MADDKLVEAVLTDPDYDKWLASADGYAGSGGDWAIARALAEWRSGLLRIARGDA